MSIFGKIASAIFGTHPAAPATLVSSTSILDTATSTATAAATDMPAGTAAAPVVAAATAAAPAVAAAAATAGAPKPTVDISAIMDKISDDQDEDLDWKKSIVDLMKLLKLDSSLSARKELAKELAYTGDMSDSAAMNVWLHKQVMTKLAENGGIVPASLKH
jgi:3-oxoacyl-ACP reductase-like protein